MSGPLRDRVFAVWPGRDAPVSVGTTLADVADAARVTLKPPPYPGDAARGQGQVVLVLPGFAAHDVTTARLRGFLTRQGFAPHPWSCGINMGPVPNILGRIEARVRDLSGAGRVALVGVSLGGTFAREIARRMPGRISRVITLNSPVRLPVVSPLAPLAHAAALLWDEEGRDALSRVGAPVPVPLTAIVSPKDGVLDWRGTVPDSGRDVEIVRIAGSHTAMGSNPQAQRIIAARLARDEGRPR
jgi:pimeloyl-ACP methyl ester carboxylesterase